MKEHPLGIKINLSRYLDRDSFVIVLYSGNYKAFTKEEASCLVAALSKIVKEMKV